MDPLNLKEKFEGLELEETEVLDLGCGTHASPLSSQVKSIKFKRLVCVDAFIGAIRDIHAEISVRPYATRHLVCRNRDVLAHAEFSLDESHDVVMMLDILEHLEKASAIKLIKECKRIARKRIIIWLPLGDCPQGDIAGNPYQVHRSTWSTKELEKLGFEVEVFKKFHKHFDPPVDAAWAIWEKDVNKLRGRKPKIEKPSLGQVEKAKVEEQEELDEESSRGTASSSKEETNEPTDENTGGSS